MIKTNEILLILNKPNLNNRIYSTETIEKSLRNIQEPILGCIGMPNSNQVDLFTASHQVSNIKIENEKLIGDVEIFNTDAGNLLKDMIKTEDIVFRIAGLGNHEEIDGITMITNFRLISINAVPADIAS